MIANVSSEVGSERQVQAALAPAATQPRPGLDELLTARQMAAWLQLSERELLEKSKGPQAKILGYWMNQRVVRFHPRAVLAKLAQDAGVNMDLYAASFGVNPENQRH